ncbi:hypothetical protein TrCOL_g1668 [Triparma columacea]|uniref:Methyltransferase type 11 domain-containing protein n=1 Tax=Triparma columacea TaxID=722753 RepID=A0A9W7LEJ3_9STRA|nr:hypothetical protein TrCOL_g1668 [Triparma columacea]
MTYDTKINMDEFVMGVKLLRWHLVSKAGGEVLEVASGTGRNLGYYNYGGGGGGVSGPMGWLAGLLGWRSKESVVTKLVLTDKSEEMVKTAKDKVSTMGLRANIQIDVGDGSDLSRFADNSFDTVVDTFGLCSFDDPVKVLLEMQRVCKKDGGKILLIEHGRSNYWEWLDNVLDEGKDQHVEKWGCEWNRDIDKIVSDSGLLVDSRSKWHFGTTSVIHGRPKQRADEAR